MAWDLVGPDVTLIAAADLSAKQYYAVALDTAAKMALVGAGAKAHGILQDAPASGAAGTMRQRDVSKAIFGASVSKGDPLTPDANSKLVKALGTDAIMAYALESGAANEIHPVLIDKDNTTGGRVITIPVQLVAIGGNVDVLTTYTPGFAGRIVKMSFDVTTPVTTAAKAATLTPFIGAVAVTGGVVALTSANATPLGKVIDGTAVTAANVFTATDTLSIKATAVTAFAEGQGVLILVLN